MNRNRVAMIAFAISAAIPPANTASRPVHLKLAAQSLGSALREFSLLTRQQIIFSEELVRGRKSPAIDGAFTIDAGLAQLLAGSGLISGRTSTGVLYIRKAPLDPEAGRARRRHD